MKKTVCVNAYAKINLSIDVIEKLDNGYHRIETVMQQIDLSDRITIESLGTVGLYAQYKIKLYADNDMLPKPEENLAYKAAKLMAETFCPFKDNKISITLNKKIPIAAGLAGGSSDAAAVMLALCKLWNIRTPLDELCKIGAKLGADIPFCIIGNAKNNPDLGFTEDELASSAALAEGIGEILTPVSSLEGWVLLARPDVSVSTREVYEKLSFHGGIRGQNSRIERPDTEELIKGLSEKNTEQIVKNMCNVLETVSLKEYPVIVYTKNKMGENCTAEKVLMSGSGPTVFCYFESGDHAKTGFSQMGDILIGDSGYRYDLHLVKLL